MSYTATLTSSGQITIPKPIRDQLAIKVGSRLNLSLTNNTLTIERKKTIDEIFASLRTLNDKLPPEAKARLKKDAGKTATELMNEYWDSPEGQRELERINYGN